MMCTHTRTHTLCLQCSHISLVYILVVYKVTRRSSNSNVAYVIRRLPYWGSRKQHCYSTHCPANSNVSYSCSAVITLDFKFKLVYESVLVCECSESISCCHWQAALCVYYIHLHACYCSVCVCLSELLLGVFAPRSGFFSVCILCVYQSEKCCSYVCLIEYVVVTPHSGMFALEWADARSSPRARLCVPKWVVARSYSTLGMFAHEWTVARSFSTLRLFECNFHYLY